MPNNTPRILFPAGSQLHLAPILYIPRLSLHSLHIEGPEFRTIVKVNYHVRLLTLGQLFIRREQEDKPTPSINATS